MDTPIIVVCPECGEVLKSHAGRNWKYFHDDGKPSNGCSLFELAFENDGLPIVESPVERAEIAMRLHALRIIRERK